MHALFTPGNSAICCTPGRCCSGVDGFVNIGCSLDARIKVGLEEVSDESAVMVTKCRISAAEVPTYRFSSVVIPQISY